MYVCMYEYNVYMKVSMFYVCYTMTFLSVKGTIFNNYFQIIQFRML